VVDILKRASLISEGRQGPSGAIAVALLAALGAGGCIGYGLYPPAPPGAPEKVVVTVREYEIDAWPRLLRQGRVIFDLVDEGALAHSVIMVGAGSQQQLGDSVGPGEREQTAADLAIGTYRLICPDSDHAKLGMTVDLVVQESAAWFRR
jgi:hypothetical protein